jgi:hypothetical protein
MSENKERSKHHEFTGNIDPSLELGNLLPI